MRILRYLLASVLVAGLSGVAKADDFQMVVIDPTVPVNLIQPIFSDNFALSFPTSGPAAGCKSSQLPGISDPQDYSACFTGINLTGAPLTSLRIEFAVFDFGGVPDTPSCPTPSTSEFPNISCGLTNGGQDYLLQFSGGDIPTATLANTFCYFSSSNGLDCDSAAIFTIAIGIPGVTLTPQEINQDFNTSISAQANVVTTPEPNSFWLMSTGVLSVGLFGAFRRRQLVALTPPRL